MQALPGYLDCARAHIAKSHELFQKNEALDAIKHSKLAMLAVEKRRDTYLQYSTNNKLEVYDSKWIEDLSRQDDRITLEKINMFKENQKFAEGTCTLNDVDARNGDLQRYDKGVRWIAFKANQFNGWMILWERAGLPDDTILSIGFQLRDMSKVKKLIKCTDDTYAKYIGITG